MEPPDFDKFLAALRSGDERAAAELVRRYEPYLRQVICLRLTDPCLRRVFDSVDICQSVLGEFFVRLADGRFQSVILLGLDDDYLVGAPQEFTLGSINDLKGPDAVAIDESGYPYLWQANVEHIPGARDRLRFEVIKHTTVVAIRLRLNRSL